MAADTQRRATELWGVPLKYLSLITLTFQNSALIIIMHYSRVMPPVNGKRYFTSTAVFLNEVMKLTISVAMAIYDNASRSQHTSKAALISNLFSEVFTGDSWKLAIPAVLYTLQNSLQYLAVSNLDAATFQVTYQLKILTTALFSVTMLGRSLSAKKWVSLVLLMIGVAVVQIPAGDASSTSASESSYFPKSIEELAKMGSNAVKSITGRSVVERATAHPAEMSRSLGLVAVIIACAISGLAGVYFEKVLKDSSATASLWVRNIQLSFYSLFPAFFIGVVFKDGADIAKSGFFTGYNWVVWTAVVFQALGGIIVALVVNYADNIAKNFATSISIIISFIASVYLFGMAITGNYIIGTAVVLYATYLYSAPDRKPSVPAVEIAEYEETRVDSDRDYYDRSPAAVNTPLMRDQGSSSSPVTPTIGKFKESSEWRPNADEKREA